jgi:cytochrome oxidase Cu insertion factor (SCO1/SenC/PrrC family)
VGGVVSVGWGLLVWVFGEAFGGVMAPGVSWLFGAPGAVLLYCCAGALIALPERVWDGPRVGRALLRALGFYFVAMAVLQAWPGRGFWQGHARPGAAPGALTAMVQQMAQTPQPSFLSSWLASFGRFDAAHGWAVNLFVVVGLATAGLGLSSARRRAARVAVIGTALLCLADWVLVQDLGFLGGVGTDPNSMVPTVLLLVTGYLALTRAPAFEDTAVVVPIGTPGAGADLRARLMANPTYTFRSIAATGALGVVLIGAVPMGVAAADPHADPVLAQAVDGAPQAVNGPAPAFSLVDQHGAPISLAGLRGKTVALTFLDDTCTTDCPVIASEFRTADRYLGTDARRVEMVAVNANPRFTAPAYLAAFDQQEGLAKLSNWLYLTGPLPELRRVWKSYGIAVVALPGGAMIGHSEYAYVINAQGRTRDLLDTDPGPATGATESSFAEMLAGTIKTVLQKS